MPGEHQSQAYGLVVLGLKTPPKDSEQKLCYASAKRMPSIFGSMFHLELGVEFNRESFPPESFSPDFSLWPRSQGLKICNKIWGIILKPQPPQTRQKYELLNCQICLVLKRLGSYFVQMFVHVLALSVEGGGHSRI